MIADKQLKSFLENVEALSNKFTLNLNLTEEKLDSIIDISQTLQVKLDPLSKKIDEYQIAINNMEACRGELLRTQNYNRTSMEVETIITNSPSGNLDEYLNAMDKVKNAIAYFKANDSQNVEYSHLDALYKRGNESIEKEFEALLNQAFPITRPESLFNLCFVKDADNDSISLSSGHTVNTDIFDSVAEVHEVELRKLSQWLLKDETMNCIVKYCTCRREALRNTIDRFKDWCRKNPNLEQTNVSMRTKTNNPKTTKRKAMSKKNLGIGHKEMKYLQGSELNKDEFEEKEAKLFTIQLVVLVKLMKNERVWLEKLSLTPNYKDKCGAMDSIVKGSINDLLSDGDEIIKMMNRAQAKHQYHHVINIILILERFVELKVELKEILEIIMEHTRRQVYNLMNRFNQIVHQCLDVYSSYIETEKISGQTGTAVPADATVHELTTNTLRFLETLLLHGEVTECILSNINISEKIFPTKRSAPSSNYKGSSSNLTTINDSKTKNPLFDYIYKVIESVIKNMLTASASYNNDIGRVIFKINNLHYVRKTIESPEFYGNYHSFSHGYKDIQNIIDENKMFYIATVIRLSNLPVKNHYQGFLTTSSKIDSNTKAHIKDMWARFNESFENLVQTHRNYVVPDRDLRKLLLTELKSSFIPKYKEFREKFLNVPFTTKRDKYIIHTIDGVQVKIDAFFSQ